MQKVFFDTNFLLRYCLDDVPVQAKKARSMIEAVIKGDLELVTDLVVICEMVWVMDSYYELDRQRIVETINNLYQTPGITVINGEIIPKNLEQEIMDLLIPENNLGYAPEFTTNAKQRCLDTIKTVKSVYSIGEYKKDFKFRGG